MVIKSAVSGYIKKKAPKIIEEAKDLAKENITDTVLETGIETTEEKIKPSILKTLEKKADAFATKAIQESGTPGTKIKGWAKIAAPGIAVAPFTIKDELEKQKIKKLTDVHEGDRIQGVIDGLKSGKSDTELLTYLEGEFDAEPTLEKIKKELGYKTNEEKIKEMTDVHEGDRIEAVISLLKSGNYNRAELESHLTGEFPPGTLDKIINELDLDPNVLNNKDLTDYDYQPLSIDDTQKYDLIESSFLPHFEFEKLRNSKIYKLLKKNNKDTSELEGYEIVPGTGSIKLPNPHHDKYDEKSLMQMVSKDAQTVIEPLLDFIIETPKDLVLSLGVAAVNGADVAVNLMPLIDKIFDYSGNPVGFKGLGDDKKVMELAQNLDVKLDKTREWIKKYKKDDNFVSQMIGIMGQDALYSIPIYNKLRDLGMPKYPAFFISGGIGGAVGIEKEIFGTESTFLMHFYSKEIQGLKNVVGILPNTPYDEIADEVVQALEYGTFSAFIPAVIQSLQFMKKNIPFYAEKTIKKNKRKSKKK